MPIVVSWREIKDRVATEEQRIHVADGLFVNADQLRDILGDFDGVTYYDFARMAANAFVFPKRFN